MKAYCEMRTEQQEYKRGTNTGCDDRITSRSCLPHIMAGKSLNVIISHLTMAGNGSHRLTDRYSTQGLKHRYEWGKTNFIGGRREMNENR